MMWGGGKGLGSYNTVRSCHYEDIQVDIWLMLQQLHLPLGSPICHCINRGFQWWLWTKLDHCPLCIIGHWFLLPPKYIKERQFRIKFLALEFRLSPWVYVWWLYEVWNELVAVKNELCHKRRSKTASEIMCSQIIRVLHKRHRIREPEVDNFLCWGVSWISKQHSSRVFFFPSSEIRLVSSIQCTLFLFPLWIFIKEWVSRLLLVSFCSGMSATHLHSFLQL